MKKLSNILAEITTTKIVGKSDLEVGALVFDSRKADANSLFFAIRGTRTDGHNFIPNVIQNGTKAIVCEELPEELNDDVCYIQVEDTAQAMASASSAFYDHPSRNLKLVGVTGTNGKTTTVTLLHQLFRKLGYQAGLLSTVRYVIGEQSFESTHTTPDSVRINELLREMVDAGCEYCFMEVSSHSMVQKRVEALEFAGGIFTNITHDHLDYHKTFKAYIEAKKEFFDKLPKQAFALVNNDDKNGRIMQQNTLASEYSFGVKTMADFKATIVEHDFTGMQLLMNGHEFWTPFVGGFNAYNLLGVFGSAVLLGENETEVLQALSQLQPVEGRFEMLRSQNGISAIVDYAHTPDALVNVLKTINQIRSDQSQLITVVGAGGDRDKTKRPEMAKAAATASSKVILTSDNPRTEDPEAILDDMQAGVPTEKAPNVLRITNRREAIRTAVHLAKAGDVVLVAGKGHETYQEINGVKHHFDDKEEILKMVNCE